VLIVDDDQGTIDTFSAALQFAGYSTVSEVLGTKAFERLRTSAVDAAVVDLRLGDLSGLDILRSLRADGNRIPFVLISAFNETPSTVAAMQMGAFDVLDKPVAVDELCTVVTQALAEPSSPRKGLATVENAVAAHSSHERLARAILAVRHAPDDPKTLSDWARLVGMSYTSLRTLCRMLDIPPHDARDLARMLRAVEQSRLQHAAPQAFLDTADERTLDSLFARAGLDAAIGAAAHDLLRTQTFVAAEHPVLKALRALLSH
jgi:CheY-like chemotaxis protein/AraC-like DNA-binding protein